jgi:hypothetical protein
MVATTVYRVASRPIVERWGVLDRSGLLRQLANTEM